LWKLQANLSGLLVWHACVYLTAAQSMLHQVCLQLHTHSKDDWKRLAAPIICLLETIQALDTTNVSRVPGSRLAAPFGIRLTFLHTLSDRSPPNLCLNMEGPHTLRKRLVHKNLVY